MENKDQPAFPIINTHEAFKNKDARENAYGYVYSMGGLTKREYFAGLAMQGMLANPNLDIGLLLIDEAAINYADDLLKALES